MTRKSATWRLTPFAHAFYHSKAWLNARKVVWDRSHGLCEECAKKGETSPADVVHHTIPLSMENMNDPDVALNPERLVALCHSCHTEAHQRLHVGALNGAVEEKPRVMFDENGNVVRIDEQD